MDRKVTSVFWATNMSRRRLFLDQVRHSDLGAGSGCRYLEKWIFTVTSCRYATTLILGAFGKKHPPGKNYSFCEDMAYMINPGTKKKQEP